MISTLAAAALALSASPASAKISDGYVRGYDTYVGDWSDEGVISGAELPVSNAVCLWQMVLLAEGIGEPDGSKFDIHDVDGHFGTTTQYATKRLQVHWGLADDFDDADGRVGPNTFGKADNQLLKTGGSTARGQELQLGYYSGGQHKFAMKRNASGIYTFQKGTTWHTAYYGSGQGTTSCD
ncbi:Tat pathway signal protein [Streptomyces sp. HC44]|uniref:Tat pathway signal protein n=1 Tax=Streptomyces scabichelini TaxID=2711217 RepID=A0A6G4VH63_9ACTN|nr:Tat pathway signal protein [Streptomyces scabichelini]NGO13127.1 Tat pathway signal protein [Streptomyces scabichelini]